LKYSVELLKMFIFFIRGIIGSRKKRGVINCFGAGEQVHSANG
jgi:hypothetical protein